MLPGIDGLEVCRRLRGRDPDLPVVMLTALGEESDRVVGLSLGADDYVTKPFSPRELVLRVQSVLRRASRSAETGVRPETLRRRRPCRRRRRRVARLRGAELALTVREFDLLVFLMRNPGRAFRRGELLEAVWGWTFGDQSTVTVHVRRLREKIEDDPADAAPDRHRVGRGLPVRGGTRRCMMSSLIFLVALAGALVVAVPGWLVLRLLRRRSITVHICVLLARHRARRAGRHPRRRASDVHQRA